LVSPFAVVIPRGPEDPRQDSPSGALIIFP
jgi:hypothetical protein